MPGVIARELKQRKPFTLAERTTSQCYGLRIRRGAQPTRLTGGELVERMVARDRAERRHGLGRRLEAILIEQARFP